jgi:hypothetical protein
MSKKPKQLSSEYLQIVEQFSGEVPAETRTDQSRAIIERRSEFLPSPLRSTEEQVDVIGDVDAFVAYIENGGALRDWKLRVEDKMYELDVCHPPLSAEDRAYYVQAGHGLGTRSTHAQHEGTTEAPFHSLIRSRPF